MSAGFGIQLAYLGAAVLFILGLKGLSSARSAPRGNALAALGMALAVAAALLDAGVLGWEWMLAGAITGATIGAFAATRVQMTSMPEMVALLNGFGGAASALVAGAELTGYWASAAAPGAVVATAIVLGTLIGCVTLSGSLVAFGKLSERIPSRALVYPGQQILNALLAIAVLSVAAVVATNPLHGALGLDAVTGYWLLAGLALLLGVLLVTPIGGADMPVVISLLNSYSGLAACATGFVLGNSGLVISGSLVGASGLILTRIMCDAMNRSLANVLFGAFGAVTESAASAGTQGAAKGYTPEDAAVIFSNARSCIVVPGYGMAVAQAQHAVRGLADQLEERGVKVQFAVHPVAGRMPGHMNVLLAEADVAYEKLVEMDEINPQFSETDVALVIGANDVVNPLARESGSAIAGMPILNVDEAQHVFVIKRSMNTGFAGVQNPLFFLDNTMMIFGDAKSVVLSLVDAVKDYE